MLYPSRLALLAILALGTAAAAEHKSAVLIGINIYNPDHPTPAKSVPPAVQRPAARGDWTPWHFPNLNGAVNDVNLMQGILESRGFTDIVVLKDQDATAQAILLTLRRKLIDETSSGDVRVVYYSGHGSTVRNEGSTERDKMDQTIVPADHFRGNVPDIRDKELSRILWKAGKKGVKVIFIADSCHSGGLSRGSWNERGMTRTAIGPPGPNTKPYPVQINDPADKDPATGMEINPIDAGVVFIAAAQEDEPAMENPDVPDGQHGAFTWALKRALESGLDQPVDLLVRRATTLLKSDSFAQQPDLRGKNLHSIGLFGQKAVDVAATTAVVAADPTEDGTILLRGGKAIGIYEGCEMKRVLSSGGPVEIRIAKSLDLVRSQAKVIESGSGATPVHKGDLFEVDKLIIPDEPMLKVYIPPAAPVDAVQQTASEIAKIKADKSVHWIDDQTDGTPTQVMHWTGSQWIMERDPSAGSPVELGASPTAAQVRAKLDSNAAFLFLVPPTTQLAESLNSGMGDASIKVLKAAGGQQYFLAGRVDGPSVEYSWIQPDATEQSVRQMAREGKVADRMPLPLRTDWVAAGPQSSNSLSEKALRLGRLRAWLTLLAPSGTPDGPFPYTLAFREIGKPGFVATNQMSGGHRYKMYLQADERDLIHGVALRWVYVFSINHYGKGTLLFPALGEGNAGNQFPKTKDGRRDISTEIPITGAAQDYDFEVGEPYGVDTFLLLASKEPIEDPQVFEFDGVRSKGASRGGGYKDPLTQLLSGISGNSRGVGRNPAVPSSWSLQQVPILSTPK